MPEVKLFKTILTVPLKIITWSSYSSHKVCDRTSKERLTLKNQHQCTVQQILVEHMHKEEGDDAVLV